ncbi:MAG: SDR family NAD(P)-dependent oxidoreductase [Actinomycetota bacterium]|nr:SDR family NAD(P)-dependent oxidoreductase [Actinomycetota bacterium]
MKNLTDKAVLVTGAAKGIGRATALAFAQEGSNPLVITDIDANGLEGTADMLEAMHREVLAVPADISDPEAVGMLVEESLERYGRIDVLANVAGVGILGPVEDLAISDWRRVIDVNLWGVINTIHYVYPHMVARKAGHIVNVSSTDGLFVSWIYSAPYCASKFGIVGISEEILFEASLHGIGVTCFCPGSVGTTIFDTSPVVGFSEEIRKIKGLLTRGADPPEAVGRMIVEAVKKDRFIVTTTLSFQMEYFLRKHLPFLWFPFMKLQARLMARMLGKYRI